LQSLLLLPSCCPPVALLLPSCLPSPHFTSSPHSPALAHRIRASLEHVKKETGG
jgi:hypothetical protein